MEVTHRGADTGAVLLQFDTGLFDPCRGACTDGHIGPGAGQSMSDGVTHVRIEAQVQESSVLLRLSDQGPGVSEQALQHLTEPFFRGNEARTSATGSGLGLAIVERAVQRMGGSFAVANQSSGGLMALIKLKLAP